MGVHRPCKQGDGEGAVAAQSGSRGFYKVWVSDAPITAQLAKCVAEAERQVSIAQKGTLK